MRLYTHFKCFLQFHTVKRTWEDCSISCAADAESRGLTTGIKPPNSSRGTRIIILHIGSMAGWVPDVGRVFIRGQNNPQYSKLFLYNNCQILKFFLFPADFDYHGDVDAQLFEQWLTTVLEKLPENSTIIMDNASYHRRRTVSQLYLSLLSFKMLQFKLFCPLGSEPLSISSRSPLHFEDSVKLTPTVVVRAMQRQSTSSVAINSIIFFESISIGLKLFCLWQPLKYLLYGSLRKLTHAYACLRMLTHGTCEGKKGEQKRGTQKMIYRVSKYFFDTSLTFDFHNYYPIH